MTRDNVTPHVLGREAMLAMRAVAEAMDLARTVEQDAAAGALSKDDASPVTIADFSVQALIAARLGHDCPSDPLVAEEDASALRGASGLSARVVDLLRRANPDLQPDHVLEWIDRGGASPGRRYWTLDPIDGTKGLLRGGQYAIALALIVDGIVQLGVLGCPRLSLSDGVAVTTLGNAGERGPAIPQPQPGGGIAVAVRGRGAWWWASSIRGSLTRLAVSSVAEPRCARVLHSVEAPHSNIAQFGRVLRTLGVELPPILMDSQAKHVVVASGGADLLLRLPIVKDFHDAIWDQAAGALLIEEAGGRVTDLTGRALDFSTGRRLVRNHGFVASNGLLHDVVLDAVQRPESAGTAAPVSDAQ
jgi:3'(2'), 5'-bisphosphate nucleotidase